ncbi:hypothetical protein L9F63_011951, partial [Diploptera punctata]
KKLQLFVVIEVNRLKKSFNYRNVVTTKRHIKMSLRFANDYIIFMYTLISNSLTSYSCTSESHKE